MILEARKRPVRLASGGYGNLLSFVADDVTPLRVSSPARHRAGEYAYHFAALRGTPVRATALPPVNLTTPSWVRDALAQQGAGELMSLRSAARHAFGENATVGPAERAWLRLLARRGCVADEVRAPDGRRISGDGSLPRAWLGAVGSLRAAARHYPTRIVTNAHFFTISPTEQPEPHGALGDPAGLTARVGVIRAPAVSRRAVLLHDGVRWRVTTLGPEDVSLDLPGAAHGVPHLGTFMRSHDHPERTHTDRAVGVLDVAIEGRTIMGLHEGGGAAIPPTGWVVRLASELTSAAWASLRSGAPVTWRVPTEPNLRVAMQGGPLLVEDGAVVVDDARVHREGYRDTRTPASPVPGQFPADATVSRAARLGVGVLANGRLLVLAIQGRSALDRHAADTERGGTLEDLAALFVEHGARSAVNLDGGGSVLACHGSGDLLEASDHRAGSLARFERLVPTGLAFV